MYPEGASETVLMRNDEDDKTSRKRQSSASMWRVFGQRLPRAEVMFFCQIIGCTKSMTTTTNDDNIIKLSWFRTAPHFGPTFMTT